jgi:hypothetical protein
VWRRGVVVDMKRQSFCGSLSQRLLDGSMVVTTSVACASGAYYESARSDERSRFSNGCLGVCDVPGS